MSSNWTAVVISDDETEPLQYQKRVTRVKKTSVPVIIDSDDDDDDSDEYKPPEKKSRKSKNQTKERGHLHAASTLTLISDDEEPTAVMLTKAPARKTVKRKIEVKNEYEQEPNLSTDSYLPKNKKASTKHTATKIEEEKHNTETYWKDHELLADTMNLHTNIAENVVNLLADGNTIPFIARYRREATGNMTPEVLREVKNTFEEICRLRQKIKTVVSTLAKNSNFTQNLEKAIKSTRSMEELDIIYAPFKPEAKRTLAERAKAVGLEQPATDLLLNSAPVNLDNYVDKSKEELSDVSNVEKGMVHIIAQKISTDSDVLSFLRDLRKQVNFTVETKRHKTKTTAETKIQKKRKIGEKPVDESKFENYFDFKVPVRYIKPHQILAINRGEHHKILSVKIVIPDFVFKKFNQFCIQKWANKGLNNQFRRVILETAIKDSYNRLVQPFIVREIRSDLKTLAEKASYEVFSKNLKHLLLAAPVKGQAILGIDPGYAHGCKIAIISPIGTVLDHNVIYPHSTIKCRTSAGAALRHMLETHDCSLIALGDGTASKQTEEWITELIKSRYFYPRDVKYSIVSEDGASIYSCSPEAKKEFDDMDTNIISAVSLARRIQDPMAELVKVQPKHLGVGMYQHDLKKKTLDEALDEVVSECVSFVGVDLNTASQALLRRIAGLTEKRASEIVKYRETNGPFIARKQLTEVNGIGSKVFQQCAGFLRVGPTNSSSTKNFYENPKTTKLDQTYIHPESYETTHQLLKHLNLNPVDIGENNFINKFKSSKENLPQIQNQIKSTKETLDFIFDALTKPLNYDLRTEVSQTAFFSTGLKSMDDLQVGSKVMGRVKNVTHFGCFADIGVGRDALIHSSKLRNFDLQVGDRVEGVISSLDKERKRIGMEPIKKL